MLFWWNTSDLLRPSGPAREVRTGICFQHESCPSPIYVVSGGEKQISILLLPLPPDFPDVIEERDDDSTGSGSPSESSGPSHSRSPDAVGGNYLSNWLFMQ